MLLRSITALFALCAFSLALAGDTAAELLKSVVDYQASLLKAAQEEAQKTGKFDMAAVQRQVRARAAEVTKQIDPAKVNPAESMDWALLFSLAGKDKESQALLVTYLGTKPDGLKLYRAQSMLIEESSLNGDAKTTTETLLAMKPYDLASSLGYASIVCNHAPEVAATQSVEDAVSLVDRALAGINLAQVTQPLQNRYDSLRDRATLTKIELYRAAGIKDRALALIDEAAKSGGPGARTRFAAIRSQLTLPGSAAPELVIERGYGEFKGLQSLKGKVVVLDFFAHWCEPCKRAFPAMRQMLSDLNGKGLAVVGVTTYYGFLGDPSAKLKPDDEFARMASFIKEQGIAWPVVFGKQDNFNAYGATSIPDLVIVDRTGIVHSLHLGYSTEEFAKARKAVEELLDRKI